MDNVFSFEVIIDNPQSQIVEECQYKKDWPKWRKTIQTKLDLLEKRVVFGHISQTPEVIKPIKCKWEFVRSVGKIKSQNIKHDSQLKVSRRDQATRKHILL